MAAGVRSVIWSPFSADRVHWRLMPTARCGAVRARARRVRGAFAGHAVGRVETAQL